MIRIDGPYQHGRRYRLRIREKGVQRVESFASEAEAIARKRKLQREADESAALTVAEALHAYESYLNAKGNKPRSIVVTLQRLKVMFRDFLGSSLRSLADGKQKLADSLDRYRSALDKPLSVDSKHNLVNQGRTFLKWCIGRGLLKENPLVGVQTRACDFSQRLLSSPMRRSPAGGRDGGCSA